MSRHQKHTVGLAAFNEDGTWHIELVARDQLERAIEKLEYSRHFTFNADRDFRDVLFNLWQLMKYRYQIEPDQRGCYLLHFSRPIGAPQADHVRRHHGHGPRKRRYDKPHAQHYLGCSVEDLLARISQQQSPRSQRGANLTKKAKLLGARVRCVRAWRGDHRLEHSLKRRHNNREYCPLCRDDVRRRKGKQAKRAKQRSRPTARRAA
jgi:hypothetical protein